MGDELEAAIKADAPASPVLTLTGFGDLMTAADQCPTGVAAVVGKPIRLAALRAALVAATTGPR